MDIGQSNVLVVDDDRSIGISVSRLLEAYGAKKSQWANSGKMAMEILKLGYVPDFIITDQNMPEMDGIEMVKQIRLLNKRLPIIMLTADDSRETSAAAGQAGVNEVISKPFDIAVLIKAISRL